MDASSDIATVRAATPPPTPVSAAIPALGSTVVVGATEPSVLADAVAHVRSRIDAVDRALSRFRPDSELARMERQPGRPWLASPLFLEVLDLACRAAASTDGWFDPTIRDAVEAAGYDRSIELIERDGPGPARPASPAGRWLEIRYDRAVGLLWPPPGVRLDFGGIGKGFAVDFALRDVPTGGGGVLVSAGGDLAVTGCPPGDGWRCEVAATPDGEPETAVRLRQGALATSGLGRRQWRRAGETLHHLIDPRTGRPGVSPWRIVTVAARTCVAAEVAAKVAWLRGDAGPDWIAGLGLTARFQAQSGTVRTVGAWPESGG
jgi:FAD:protein FMN transferase